MAVEQSTKNPRSCSWGKSLANQEFGRLVVYRRDYEAKWQSWICYCSCGSVVTVQATHLKSGSTVSCGCYSRDTAGLRNRKHGKTGTAEYRIWSHMQRRCDHVTGHKDYGLRGIRVCERWSGTNGFANFLADMGERPSNKHSIDRYPNNNGNYEPGNCRWAVQQEQMRNMRRNFNITFQGVTRCVTEWAIDRGVHWNTLKRWVLKHGVEKAMTAPIKRIAHKNSGYLVVK